MDNREQQIELDGCTKEMTIKNNNQMFINNKNK